MARRRFIARLEYKRHFRSMRNFTVDELRWCNSRPWRRLRHGRMMENGSEGMAERERSMCSAFELIDVLNVDDKGGRYFERFGVDVIGIDDWKVSISVLQCQSKAKEMNYIELSLPVNNAGIVTSPNCCCLSKRRLTSRCEMITGKRTSWVH